MAPSVSFSVTPNIGAVVNQNQGFVVAVTVSVPATDPVGLEDVKLMVTSVPPNITTGVGINIPISMSSVPLGTSQTVKVVFETDAGITVGNKNIDFKCSGYLGGPEWLEVIVPPTTLFPVALHEVFPAWTDAQTVTVNIVEE